MLDNETAQRSRLAIFRERGLVTARWKRCWKRDPFDDRLGFVKGFHAHRSSCVFRHLCSKTILLVRNIHALRKWENGRKHRSIDGSIITSSRFSRFARNTGGLIFGYSYYSKRWTTVQDASSQSHCSRSLLPPVPNGEMIRAE